VGRLIFWDCGQDFTHIYFIEKKFFEGAARILKKVTIPINVQTVPEIKFLYNERVFLTRQQAARNCSLLFANYIKNRINGLALYHDYALTMNKIELAGKVIGACGQYEKDGCLEIFKQTIKEMFRQAIELECRRGAQVDCRNSIESKSDYPGGTFGIVATEAFKMFNFEDYQKMCEHDRKVDRLHEEYLHSLGPDSRAEIRALPTAALYV
jgi:adenine-specific DNA methylase